MDYAKVAIGMPFPPDPKANALLAVKCPTCSRIMWATLHATEIWFCDSSQENMQKGLMEMGGGE
jgi:hypothetical protein